MRDAMIVVVRVAAPQSVADMTLDCLPDWTVQQLKKLISERHELHPVSEFSFLQSSGLGLLTQISNYLSHTSIWTPVSNPWNEFGGGMSFRMSLAQSNKPKWSRDESGCRSLQKTEAELSRELNLHTCSANCISLARKFNRIHCMICYIGGVVYIATIGFK